MRRHLAILLAFWLIALTPAAHALTQKLDRPILVKGTPEKPAIVMPYTVFTETSAGLQASYRFYDLDVSSIRGELSTYRIIYGAGQVIHGAAYSVRR